MSQSNKKSTTRRKNRRLHKMLNRDESLNVPMRAHGFGATSLEEALVLPLRLDNETAYLGLWARLGDDFESLWEQGPTKSAIHLIQEPRGQWALERESDTSSWRSLVEPNFKKLVQKRGVSLSLAHQVVAAIEEKLSEGPQPMDVLKTHTAPLELEEVLSQRSSQEGHDSVFDVVLDALFRSRRLVKVPHENTWDFHLWRIALSPPSIAYEEALLIWAGRYCEAFPFAQLEDFVWWAQLQKSKAKEGFIKAKTAWRNQQDTNDEGSDIFYGLFFTPYRDSLSEANRYYEKAWGLNVDPHPRAPGGLPLVILDGQVIGYWCTEDGLVALEESLEALCEEEESTLYRFKEDMADTVVFRFSDLLPVYDIYR